MKWIGQFKQNSFSYFPLLFPFLIFFIGFSYSTFLYPHLRPNPNSTYPAVDLTGGQFVQELHPVSSEGEMTQLFQSDSVQPIAHETLNLGYTAQPYWIHWRINFKNLNYPTKIHFLESTFPDVTLYLKLPDGSWTTQKSGTLHMTTDSGSLASFDLPTHVETAEAYLRVRCPYQLYIRMKYGDQSTLKHENLNYCFMAFIYCGVLILAMFQQLIYYQAFQNRTYFSYFIFLFCMFCVSFTVNGLSALLWPPLGAFLTENAHIVRVIPGIGFAFFGHEFLHLKTEPPFWSRACLLFEVGYLLFFIGTWAMGPKVYYWVDPLNTTVLLFFVTAGIKAWKKGLPGAREYVLGEIVFALGIFYWMLANFGVIPASFFTTQAPATGGIGEAIFFSLAIVRYFEHLQTVKERAEQQKSRLEDLQRFVRVLAHDLANPLNVILLTSEKVPDSPENAEKDLAKRTRMISRAANQMQIIIDQTKKVLAQDSGKASLDLVPVLLSDVVDDTRFIFEEKIKEKGLTLEIHQPDKTLSVLADRTSLSTNILNNLVSNAIKFTPRGGKITVSVDQVNSRVIQIQVKDTGIGIPESLLSHVFDTSKNTSRSGTEGESGTGFGMPLVKQFAESFGAQIKIESTPMGQAPQHGTVVSILFPMPLNRPNRS